MCRSRQIFEYFVSAQIVEFDKLGTGVIPDRLRQLLSTERSRKSGKIVVVMATDEPVRPKQITF